MSYSSDESYIPDWEPFVTNDGQLFYVELSQPTITSKIPELTKTNLGTFRNEFSRVSTRRSGRGVSKLSKLISSRSKNKQMIEEPPLEEEKNPNEEPVHTEVNIKLIIDPSERYKFGRRSSLTESLLGIITQPSPDGQKIMISGFASISEPDLSKIISIGDWLKYINGHEVNAANLDSFLMSIDNPIEVQITVQKMLDPNAANMNNKFCNLNAIIKNLNTFFPLETKETDTIFSLMYLTMEGTTDQGPEGQDVVFCYPNKNSNELYACRGSFLTINSVLIGSFNSTAECSTVQIEDLIFHVVYSVFNEDLLLIAFSSKIMTAAETMLKAKEIQRCLEFSFRTLPSTFKEPHINHLSEVCKLIEFNLRHDHDLKKVKFESSLVESHLVALPKEAQLRIDDALSEMEAMDYREWNDEPLKSHREFFILGSALYYKSFLLANHLPVCDLVDINTFLKTHGVYDMMSNPTMKELIIWKEVFLKSCERGLVKNDKIYGIPQGRWFLNIVGRGTLFLAVVLESRYTDQKFQYITPSPFYVEEIQDTVEHLRTGGIENLAGTWIGLNKRPQCANPKTESHSLSSSLPSKKSEMIPFLKRRSTSSENISENNRSQASSSMTSRTPSEDSHNKYDDDDSDSDWDGFPDSHKSSSGFDVSEMTETLLKEVGDIIPSKLTAGSDNVLYYYVQLEVGEGILLAPTTNQNPIVIEAFRNAAHSIHEILQETIRFRQILSQETSKPNVHKSSVAIKEHGILIEVIAEGWDCIEFWVIGRLFLATGRETYLCHRADVPQNMVEIAFRLQLNSTG